MTARLPQSDADATLEELEEMITRIDAAIRRLVFTRQDVCVRREELYGLSSQAVL